MKKNSLILLAFFSVLILLVNIAFLPSQMLFKSKGNETKSEFRDGDIIFQTSSTGQSLAIQLATHSKFTHCGILFKENGAWIVYEAVQPVKRTSLKDWINQGDNHFYEVRRLRNADSLLTTTVIEKMRSAAAKRLGKDYDIYFNWDEERLYCSELVWKIYKDGAGIQVGTLHRLRYYDLSSPLVKKTMQERYGDRPPLDDYMISPQDIFESSLLVTAKTRNTENIKMKKTEIHTKE